MWGKLVEIYKDPIVSGLLTTLITAIIAALWRLTIRRYRKAIGYLEGDWFGHLLADGNTQLIIHELNFNFTLNPIRPVKVTMKELSDEHFRYEGHAKAIDRLVICYLDGQSQFDEAFLVLRSPFNKGVKLDYMSGILSGVTHNSHPGAAFILLSRSRLSKESVIAELPAQPGPIVVDADPIAIETRKLKPSAEQGSPVNADPTPPITSSDAAAP